MRYLNYLTLKRKAAGWDNPYLLKLLLSNEKSLLNELWESSEINAFQKRPVSASSLCEARQKLPEEVFIEFNKAILLNKEKSIPFPMQWLYL